MKQLLRIDKGDGGVEPESEERLVQLMHGVIPSQAIPRTLDMMKCGEIYRFETSFAWYEYRETTPASCRRSDGLSRA